MSTLEVKDLSYSVGPASILKGLSSSFNEKSLTCILGPNGAGKTTLIKTICGLIKYSGSILLNNENLGELDSRAIARQVAYVPQHISSELTYTVKDFILLSRYPWQGLSEIEADKFDHILEITGLREHQEQTLSTLSGGERQRTLIAAALVQDTQIILLDEITSALDPKYQEQVIQLLLKIRDQGKTLIWATHDLNVALLYADKLLALKDGNIFKSGTADEFISEDTFEKLFDRKFTKITHPDSGKVILV
ncbi:MAG: ABC transporter ATP-binding protein [Lentisphaeraceae bacterium]|nr:ABC transporter ATP-binding protein [Lentisphaeraceae bacterium]